MTTNYEISKVVEPYTDRIITTHVSSKSLRKLIRKVKQGNIKAMDRLCSLYVPIVRSVYTNPIVKYLLGEDAIDIVWELFIVIVKQYNGNDYKRFPGLVKSFLIKRIKNNFRKSGSYKALVIPSSDTLDMIEKNDIKIDTYIENAGFYQLLEGCTKRQIKIAELIYMYNLERLYVAKIMHCSKQNIFKTLDKIHARAKENYYKRK